MKRRTLILAGIIGLAIGAIVNLPLKWVGEPLVPKSNMSDLGFSGTIWKGHVTGFPGLGPIAVKTFPMKAITGKPFLEIETKSANLSASGVAKPGRLSNVVVSGNMAHVAAIDNRFSGLTGNFNMTLDDMTFGKTCNAASGTVTTNVLSQNLARLQWVGPDLSGPIRCEDGNFVMELEGQDSQQSIKVLVRLMPDGALRADINVLTKDDRAGMVLPLFGFQPKNGGYSLRESGRWM